MIHFACPHCNERMAVADDRAGTKIMCAACLKSFAVPMPSGIVVQAPPAPPPTLPPFTDTRLDASTILPPWFAPHTAVGFVGAAMLIVGVFLPLMNVPPSLASINFIGTGDRDGVFVLVLGAIAIPLVWTKRNKWLLFIGLAVIFLLTFDFVGYKLTFRRDNSLAQLQYGILVMVAGAIAVVVAAAMGQIQARPRSRGTVKVVTTGLVALCVFGGAAAAVVDLAGIKWLMEKSTPETVPHFESRPTGDSVTIKCAKCGEVMTADYHKGDKTSFTVKCPNCGATNQVRVKTK